MERERKREKGKERKRERRIGEKKPLTVDITLKRNLYLQRKRNTKRNIIYTLSSKQETYRVSRVE